MSFSFWARAPREVGLADVLATALRDGASTVEDDVEAAAAHVYLPGVSTRGVELFREDDDIFVRLLTCSAPEEYALGTSLVTASAELSGTDVESEDGWQGAPATVGDQYGAAWITGEVASGARIALTLAAMRRAQWPGDGYYAASAFQLTSKQTRTGVSFAVWADTGCVVPDVELVILHSTDADEPLHVPRESVPAFAGAHWSWLDERQLLLEPVPDEDWPAVLAAAEPYRVELPD